MAAIEKTATIEFDEYPDEEIVVRIAPIPLDDYFGVLEDIEELASADAIRAAFRRFADLALVSWTFPEPATGEGMLRRDMNLGLAVIRQWAREVREVALPLPRASSGGGRSARRKTSRKR